jgi:hypothetical protein
MPMMRKTPDLPGLDVTDSIGPLSASADEPGLTAVIVSVSVRVTSRGSKTRPTIDTRAIRAGNMASTP